MTLLCQINDLVSKEKWQERADYLDGILDSLEMYKLSVSCGRWLMQRVK